MEYYYRWYYDSGDGGALFWCGHYPVTKRTHRGAWIDEYGKARFILNDSVKKWAAPTQDEAWIGMKRRLARRRVIVRHQLSICEEVTADPRYKLDTAPSDKEYFPWQSTGQLIPT